MAIIDVYSGSVRTVDHVPAGIAIAGAQVSSFGYHITDLMEQAFATPRMTEQGYGAALEILKRVRLATLNVYSLQMATAPTADADLPRSWQQYIADCPLKGLQNELRHKTGDEIWNKPLLTEGLRFESRLWGTKLDLTRPYTEPTCSEALSAARGVHQVVYLPYFKDVLAKKLRYASMAELEEKIELALAAMGLTANADTYLMTSALSSVYFAAMRQRAAEDFQPAYAAAVDDAVQQRNAQWMADESLFQVYVRPLLTFLEGFVYAMVPVLVLLVGLGPYGIQVIMGFFADPGLDRHLDADAGDRQPVPASDRRRQARGPGRERGRDRHHGRAVPGRQHRPDLPRHRRQHGRRRTGADRELPVHRCARLRRQPDGPAAELRPGHVQGGEGEPGQPACRGDGQLPGPVHVYRRRPA